MPLRDSLGDRMKEYERRNQYWLQKRTPVAIRVDMRAGHSFTKGFQRPFDEIFVKSMQRTMKFMCENIEGAVFGFCQSDEITIILQDYKTLTTEAWFDYRTDKLCSIAASMATMAFDKYFSAEVNAFADDNSIAPIGYFNNENDPLVKRYSIYCAARDKGAMFDARVFNIPKEEVTNLVYWRQLDATRNSIQMLGQAYFSHNQLQGKSCNDIQDMLVETYGINWNNFPTYMKRGTACVKELGGKAGWSLDLDMPMLKGEDRKYLDELIYIGE